jgi:hypothetical protein
MRWSGSARLWRSLEQCLVHRGNRGRPGRLEVSRPFEEAELAEAGRADDPAIGLERAEERRHDAVDVEQPHHIGAAIVVLEA